MKHLVIYKSTIVPRQAASPDDLVFFTAVSSSLLAVLVIFQKQLLLIAPLQHLALGLTVC